MTAASDAREARYSALGLFDRIRSHPAGNVTIVFLVALAACVIISAALPGQFRFNAPANIQILLRAIPILGIMSLGVGLLMIAGEYDLSVGAVFGVSSYMAVYAFVAGWPLVVAIPLALAVGAVFGFINGWITLTLSIPSFITTLGTLFIIRSSGRIVSGNKPLSFFPPEWFQTLLTGKAFGFVPAQFIWFIAFAVLAWLLLNRHWLGNRFFAVGGNRNASVQVGVNVYRTKMAAFVLCSMFAVAAGILSVTRINSGTTEPQTFLELNAVAACVMGGLALTGGRGSILGIFVGACMFHLVQDVILLARLPGYYLDFFVGLVIVFGVTMNQFAKKTY